jgi:hypothetical protein
MAMQNKENNRHVASNQLQSKQMITPAHLALFKHELLEEINSRFTDLINHDGKKWLRSVDVKNILGISHGTLQNFRIHGDLPYIKIRGVLFYDYADVKQMISSNRIHNK